MGRMMDALSWSGSFKMPHGYGGEDAKPRKQENRVDQQD